MGQQPEGEGIMINDDYSRPELTRGRAFDYVGKLHWIPANMGVRWLSRDLNRELAGLERGKVATLDYRGMVDGAPLWQLERSAGGVITLRSLDGELDFYGSIQGAWAPSPLADRDAMIAHDILGLLLRCRRATRVILVPPSSE